MIIRSFTPSDAASASEIEKCCFSDPWSENAFAEALENGLYTFLAAEENGSLAGYAGMYCVMDEANIVNVAVSPEHRRKGIGYALVSALLRIAEQNRVYTAYLEVRASNAPAIALYTSLGFDFYGRRRGYYVRPAEDALLMCRRSGEINSLSERHDSRQC